MALVAEGPPKYCPDCGFMRPRSDFYGHHGPNGKVYALSRCKEHSKQRIMAAAKANPDRTRASHKRHRENRKRDPERLALHRDIQRESARRRLGITPDRYRVGRPIPASGETVAPEPFSAWLASLGRGPTAIALVVGMDEAQVRKYLKCERQPTLDVVDRALLYANTITTLDDLYPLEEAA